MERRSEEVEPGGGGATGAGSRKGDSREQEVETENPGQMCKQA